MKTILAILIFLICYNVQSQVQKLDNDLFFDSDPKTEEKENCGVDIKFNPLIHENLAAPYSGTAVDFIWPFDKELDEGLILVNYIDHQSGSGIIDYNSGTWSYSGHKGTDICVKDFRAMDRFFPVKAAAAGIVVELSINNFDRNTATGNGLPANYICIKHNDGTYAYYYHFMKKSIVVKLGEYVTQDQLLGYVGSSGNSSDAHLHFEPGSFVNGTWQRRDPWQGSYNHAASLWVSQYPYVGTRAFTLHDCGVFTASATGGNMSNIGDYFKERIIAPNTISGYTDTLGFWIHLQGVVTNKQIRFQIYRPNGSLFKETSTYLNSDAQNGYIWWTPTFNQGISDAGDWYVRILYDNVEKKRCFFDVELFTSYRPKMYPVAAKCFRPAIFVQRDTLRVRPIRANMEYELVNPPPNVTLTNDSILSIGAFDLQFRYRDFKVIASMGGSAALRDTMLYKLIDTTKIVAAGNGIQSVELNAKLEGFWNGSTMEVDTITAILRSPIFPYLFIDSARVPLQSNGSTIANFFNISPNIYYYLIIKHRNSIETWSKTYMQFYDGYPITYDFTTSKTQAYGDNLKLKSGDYCIYSGDINQDGFINLTDLILVYNDANSFATGYIKTDVTGDNETDLTDVVITYNNSSNFVQKIRP